MLSLTTHTFGAPDVVSKQYLKSLVSSNVWVEVPATSESVEYSYKGKQYSISPGSKGVIDRGARNIKFTEGSIIMVLGDRRGKIERVYKVSDDFMIESFSFTEKFQPEYILAGSEQDSGKGVNLDVPDYPTGKGVNLDVPSYPTGKGVNLDVPNFPTGKGVNLNVPEVGTPPPFNPPLPLVPFIPPPRTFVTDGN